MGPYGPIWTRMVPYIILYCFYLVYINVLRVFNMVVGGLIHALYMLTHVEHLFYTSFITFLEMSKDHFPRPPAHNFDLLFDFHLHVC